MKLIGTHLDEDENIVRALQQNLGMTQEEIAECGFADECDPKTRLEHRLKERLKEYFEQWLTNSPLDLIERSDEISTVRNLAADLPDMLNQDEMVYLLRFKNPLEIAADAWCGSTFAAIGEEEFREALFEARERFPLDELYELTDTAAAARAAKSARTVQPKRGSRER